VLNSAGLVYNVLLDCRSQAICALSKARLDTQDFEAEFETKLRRLKGLK